MTQFLLNALVGLVAYEVLFLAGSLGCGERVLSAPFFIFPMGLACGVTALWWGWNGTLALVGLYAVLVAGETWRVRRSWKE